MSIEKDYGVYYLVCDICGQADDEEFDCWSEASDYAKETDWEQKYEGGGWINICPECQK